ncbi:MAG: NusG domain II-containing protein [Lachnospiraceae bacterium]|nr:NusG domain II-containing protein [Lachnospiraceae bacterium]
MKRLFGRKDIIFISILLLISGCLFLMNRFLLLKQGDKIQITVGDKLYGEYSLANDQDIPIVIHGEVTDTVTIKDGSAYMSEASCPDRLCMKMGKISKDQETIVCLPYKIVVTVVSEEESDYDSIAN